LSHSRHHGRRFCAAQTRKYRRTETSVIYFYASPRSGSELDRDDARRFLASRFDRRKKSSQRQRGGGEREKEEEGRRARTSTATSRGKRKEETARARVSLFFLAISDFGSERQREREREREATLAALPFRGRSPRTRANASIVHVVAPMNERHGVPRRDSPRCYAPVMHQC